LGILIVGFGVGWMIFSNPFHTQVVDLSSNADGQSQQANPPVDAIDQSSNSQTGDKTGKVAQDTINLDTGEKFSFDLKDRKEQFPLRDKAGFIAWMTSHTKEKLEYLEKRWKCNETLLTWSKAKSITHDRVLEGFLRTPREYFCREKNLARAYDFTYLDIGWGQTISGPEIVARMTNALNPEPDHKTLEIGTGSGYQSAFLAQLSNHVYTIEIVEELAKVTDGIYKNLVADYPEYTNVHRKIADGYYGWEEHAPFDRIIVTCGIDHIPPPLLKQLAPEGVMVIPVGPPSGQTILKITKHVDKDGNVALEREDIYVGTGVSKSSTTFVPFKASDGSSHSSARDGND
jgi:protein-L-isoaspartate(D-aspartate) O-methyltransferase